MHKLQLTGPFSQALFSKQALLWIILGSVILTQSLGVIYSRQTRRLLHAELQSLYSVRDKLHIEWNRLLLEQGTWQADARVEKIARDKLGMVVPEKTIVITP